ncbi:hypothetical protein ES708_20479 [subsurface metagenome]
MSGCSPLEIIFGPSGSIDVATYPSGAKIFLNGRDTGYITPHTIPNLIKGTYKIKVTFEDKSYTETVIVYSGCPTSVYKDLFPHLKEIIVNPDFLYTKIGETRNFSTITAYYFDVDHSPEVIKLSDCSYAKDNGHAIINSEKETFTGISKGQTKVTISYTEGEFTEIDLVDIYVNTFPTPPPEPIPDPDPGPEEVLKAKVTITNLEQYLDYAWIYYEIENTGSIDIDFYQIWFTVKCTDDSEYTDWTVGLDLKIGDKRSDVGLVNVGGKTAESVGIKNWELTNYDF